MISLVDFCNELGIIVDRPPKEGGWTRYKTKSHKDNLNGAVKLSGDTALVQNWENMDAPVVWRSGVFTVDKGKVALNKQESEKERDRLKEEAAARARSIVDASTVQKKHPYMARKGFKETNCLVNQGCVVVPTYVNRELVGCQRINEKGEKRFLRGQITKGAGYRIGRGDIVILCEGYATALTIYRVSKLLKWSVSVITCFSAMNIKHVASVINFSKKKFVVADNDESGVGIACAKETGWPVLTPSEKGEDFNDLWVRCGDYQAREVLRLFEITLGG